MTAGETPGRTIGPGLLLDESANNGMLPPRAVSSTVTVTFCPSLNIGSKEVRLVQQVSLPFGTVERLLVPQGRRQWLGVLPEPRGLSLRRSDWERLVAQGPVVPRAPGPTASVSWPLWWGALTQVGAQPVRHHLRFHRTHRRMPPIRARSSIQRNGRPPPDFFEGSAGSLPLWRSFDRVPLP